MQFLVAEGEARFQLSISCLAVLIALVKHHEVALLYSKAVAYWEQRISSCL